MSIRRPVVPSVPAEGDAGTSDVGPSAIGAFAGVDDPCGAGPAGGEGFADGDSSGGGAASDENGRTSSEPCGAEVVVVDVLVVELTLSGGAVVVGDNVVVDVDVGGTLDDGHDVVGTQGVGVVGVSVFGVACTRLGATPPTVTTVAATHATVAINSRRASVAARVRLPACTRSAVIASASPRPRRCILPNGNEAVVGVLSPI
ncbi:MAG: hypothetical protein ACYDH6_19850 [Acidimicrobiales bacterium]